MSLLYYMFCQLKVSIRDEIDWNYCRYLVLKIGIYKAIWFWILWGTLILTGKSSNVKFYLFWNVSYAVQRLSFIFGNHSGQCDGTFSKTSLEVNKWIFWSIFYLSKSILPNITKTGKRAINSQPYQQWTSYANVGWILDISSFSRLRQTRTSKKLNNETKVYQPLNLRTFKHVN